MVFCYENESKGLCACRVIRLIRIARVSEFVFACLFVRPNGGDVDFRASLGSQQRVGHASGALSTGQQYSRPKDVLEFVLELNVPLELDRVALLRAEDLRHLHLAIVVVVVVSVSASLFSSG